MVDIVCAIVAALSAVVVSIISARVERTQARREKRETRRCEESRLNLELTLASLELTEVCANALTGGHNNGNVERAREKVKTAKEKYEAFMRRIVSEEI